MVTSSPGLRARLGQEHAEEAEPKREPAAVLAIVVTHRGRPWIRSCLASMSEQTYELMDILVVDDASPDHRGPPPLRRVVKRHCRRRRWGYLRTPRPLGFGGAINWALARIRTDADLLLFMHDDAALEKDAVKRMVDRLDLNPRAAIVGPKIVSWSDPAQLEEVGMAVDRFGYPYKGLERGEIDLGQHDHPSEVFFVTSTCLIIRHEVFRQLHGWDAQMGAFSEDLDLCWRARLAGHSVRVEPTAKARHAIALATGRRRSQFVPTRYFIRRNRLRSVVKNASSARLLLLLPQFVLLALAEMLGFVVLRQYGEIVNIGRALGWNLLRAPQTIAARLRVQRTRKVADRTLTRLTVRESTRLRAYIGHQAERLEEAWGRRAELFSERAVRMRAARRRLSGWPAVAAAAIVLAVLVGWRNYLWAGPAAVGQLLPYPDRGSELLGAYLWPWQDVELGRPGPGPPALVPLGLFSVLAFGVAGLAQKLLVVALVAAGGVGAYRLMVDVVPPPGRWVAASLYILGGVGYAGLRQGSLGTLVLGATLPLALRSVLRITGWVRPGGYDRGAEIARLAIAGGLAGAVVPGALALFLAAALLLSGARGLISASSPWGGLAACGGGVLASWALLLPWSATWWSPGGALEAVSSQAGSTWSSASDVGMLDVVLGQVPGVPLLAGLAPVVPAAVAVVVATGQRRRVALALWTLVVGSGLLLEGLRRGLVLPVMASPDEAGVLPALCLALLAGVAVGASLLDLPRRRLGLWQPLVLGGLSLSLALFLAGLLPALWSGGWEPGRDLEGLGPDVVAGVTAVLEPEAASEGKFRALWVGEGWFGPRPAGVAGPDHTLSGPSGPLIDDLYPDGSGPGAARLQSTIAAVEQSATDRGGRLLGAFNIRYVVVARAALREGWLRQRDLGVVRSEPEYLLLENGASLPRAGVLRALPPGAGLGRSRLETAAAVDAEANLTPQGRARFGGEGIQGPGVVWLAENPSPGWSATLGGRKLSAVEEVWGNAFRLPPGSKGELEVTHLRPLGHLVWFGAAAVGWLAAFGAATARKGSEPVLESGRVRGGRGWRKAERG